MSLLIRVRNLSIIRSAFLWSLASDVTHAAFAQCRMDSIGSHRRSATVYISALMCPKYIHNAIDVGGIQSETSCLCPTQ